MCRIYPSACQAALEAIGKGPTAGESHHVGAHLLRLFHVMLQPLLQQPLLGVKFSPPASLTPPRTSVPLTSSSKVLWRALQGKKRGSLNPLCFFSFNSSLSLNPTQHQEAGSSTGCLTSTLCEELCFLEKQHTYALHSSLCLSFVCQMICWIAIPCAKGWDEGDRGQMKETAAPHSALSCTTYHCSDLQHI